MNAGVIIINMRELAWIIFGVEVVSFSQGRLQTWDPLASAFPMPRFLQCSNCIMKTLPLCSYINLTTS
jgi:hypothetical protein